MRIIAGTAKGRKLKTIKNNHTRPTSDRVKESLFNILGYPLDAFSVLDLFAGTGNLGLEALSRGAKKAVFVDNDSECYKIIRENITELGFDNNAVAIKKDCMLFIKNNKEKFDIIFMDPPYKLDSINELILAIFDNELLSAEGALIVEHDGSFSSEIKPFDRRKYGQTYLSFYKWVNYEGV